jgi:hypothetical protein
MLLFLDAAELPSHQAASQPAVVHHRATFSLSRHSFLYDYRQPGGCSSRYLTTLAIGSLLEGKGKISI